ncbi:hypothetical protein LTR10_004699 [Elasticomyces elasticus]|nr:hypothetical protein LTR10_004699 [Elasticomyces elasticus]KAK4977018.1 hypothetical protein LTR42_003064 [Elasticomyces elasticus]
MTKSQWMLELEQNGYVVIPNVIPQVSCDAFVESSLEWLEGFPHGFKRDDRNTWDEEHLPFGQKGGLYNRYSVNHEAFVWKIRTEPGILKAFEEVWGTDDLIASFDGFNVSLPVNAKTGRSDIKTTNIDQNPRKIDRFELYQGIANMAPNGPSDGGLVVLAGSHRHHEKHFGQIGGFRPHQDQGINENGYDYTAEDADWYRAQGCEEVKICANAGDLILWDSRTIHWNASPVGDQIRYITYVCYCPRSMATEQELQRKLEVFQERKGTTHWPNMSVIPADGTKKEALPRRPDGSVDPANRYRPFHEPEETPVVMRLVGVRA